MSPFFKPEKCNHHFPELNRRVIICKWLASFFNVKKVAAVMISLIFVIGFVYTMQINVSATQGYHIKDLNKEVQKLKEENKKLNLEYIELQAMANVIDNVDTLNLVNIDKMEIINPMDSSVALR